MAFVSDGVQSVKNAADSVSQMSQLVEMPEMVAQMYKSVDRSPEKVRALLNLMFVPLLRPGFVAPQRSDVPKLQDVDAFGTPPPQATQKPFRMFDIDTGNMVEYPTVGTFGQYCMLSHRWKGTELTLSNVRTAISEGLQRYKNSEASGTEYSAVSDVQLVLQQCRLEVDDQVKKIANLPGPNRNKIREHLIARLDEKEQKYRVQEAQKRETESNSKLRFAKMELSALSSLLEESDAKRTTESTTPAVALEEDKSPLKWVLKDADSEARNAKENLIKVKEANKPFEPSNQEDIQAKKLREAIDEMIRRLERWKSAIKLEESIKYAKEVFDEKFLQEYEKRYIWLDTCCIDKSNAVELTESLSLMGDWYAGAQFCLVKLDTNYREGDVVQDWTLFNEGTEDTRIGTQQPATETLNEQTHKSARVSKLEIIDDFGQIGEGPDHHPATRQPEWSTRGWTLQELVMSRATFFVNSEWKPLSRPVESLGSFYYLIPYIAQYSNKNIDLSDQSTLNEHLQAFYSGELPANIEEGKREKFKTVIKRIEKVHTSSDGKEEPGTPEKASKEAVRVKRALVLIMVLNCLGFEFPRDVTLETARSEATQAVYLAASNLAADTDSVSSEQRLFDAFRDNKIASEEGRQIQAQQMINYLLKCLVDESLDLIQADRRYLAKFNRVEQIQTWVSGCQQSGFSAQSVLSLSCYRTSTKAVDHIYSLMGILGVRIPTFNAEGYAKALSRLLDEILISRADVSVFNWSGMEMGSPIKGRSMYPSSHQAFSEEVDRGQRSNLALCIRVNKKMDESFEALHAIISILGDLTKFVKQNGRKNIPFVGIQRIVSFFQSINLESIRPWLDIVGKIVGYVKQSCYDLSLSPTEEIQLGDGASPAKEKSPLSPITMPSISGLKASSTKGLESFKPSLKSPKIGKGLKSPFGRKTSAEKTPVAESRAAEAATAHVEAVSVDTQQHTGVASRKSSLEAIDVEVTKWIEIVESSINKSQAVDELGDELLEELRKISYKISGPSLRMQPKASIEDGNIICPNPIIVNNSGIEGIFDIQRVIVRMIDPIRIRNQVDRAVGPREIISGWCTISTGFAMVLVNFSCEKNILEKELDVVETVQNRVLKQKNVPEGFLRSISINKMIKHDASGENTGLKTAVQQEDNGPPTEDEDQSREKQVKEEQVVARMIEFIQEPELHLVAGEWVLARFSGTPGAEWFLCHLELGSTHQFYGRRIATGTINFREATVERGLLSVWETYMQRKKNLMCKILDSYMYTKGATSKGEDALLQGAKSGLEAGLKMGFGSKPSKAQKDAATSVGDEEVAPGEDDDDSEEDSILDNLASNRILSQSKLFTTLLADTVEKLSDLRADHLSRHLSVSVLKETPKNLQSAVENMSHDRSFLPAMFHSSRKIHMF